MQSEHHFINAPDARVIPRSACLLVTYGVFPGKAPNAMAEATLTIEPRLSVRSPKRLVEMVAGSWVAITAATALLTR